MEKDRNKKIEKTKANILEALLMLLRRKEINEISIRELTEAAHIQYFLYTLYRYIRYFGRSREEYV